MMGANLLSRFFILIFTSSLLITPDATAQAAGIGSCKGLFKLDSKSKISDSPQVQAANKFMKENRLKLPTRPLDAHEMVVEFGLLIGKIWEHRGKSGLNFDHRYPILLTFSVEKEARHNPPDVGTSETDIFLRTNPVFKTIRGRLTFHSKIEPKNPRASVTVSYRGSLTFHELWSLCFEFFENAVHRSREHKIEDLEVTYHE